jgi:toxin ParE1/3/4
MGFRLTRRAEQDLIFLSEAGIRLFGVAQAKRYHDSRFKCFALLSVNPEMARLRPELFPDIRIHPFKSHLIVYRVDSNGDLLFVRIRHGREDWMTEPEKAHLLSQSARRSADGRDCHRDALDGRGFRGNRDILIRRVARPIPTGDHP